MDKQTFTPVTFGYLRREAKWLHLYCTVCGHERELDVSQPPVADTRPRDGLQQVRDEGEDLVGARVSWGVCRHPEALAAGGWLT